MNLREEKSIIEMERNESIAVLESSTSASSNEEGESEPEEVYDASGSQSNKKRIGS